MKSPRDEDNPVFLELCAGNAKLSAAVKQKRYDVVFVDHDKNRHAPRCKIFVHNLGHEQAWSMLELLLQRVRIAGVHMAPPCGTCSKARGIPLPNGEPGPQPLRSSRFPLGLPSLNSRDQHRVSLANQIYDSCGAFAERLSLAGIPWTIENPTNSMMRSLEYFTWAISNGYMVNMHACAFGSSRKKFTIFYTAKSSNECPDTAMGNIPINHGALLQTDPSIRALGLNTPPRCVYAMPTCCMNYANSNVFTLDLLAKRI